MWHRTSHICLQYVHINASKVCPLKENIPHPHPPYINQLATGNCQQQLSCAESNWQMQSTPNLPRTSAFYARSVQLPTQRAHRSLKYEHNVWFRAEQISPPVPSQRAAHSSHPDQGGSTAKGINYSSKQSSVSPDNRSMCERARERL